jgi:phosphoribosyl-AMP cyclohydrolase / phosphoribosyl-ATP pyrophosphohydrolase
VAEEAGEVLIAAKGGKKDEIVYEVADLFFHTLMVLGYHDITLQEIYQELGERFGKSGLRPEKQGGGDE